MQFKDKQVQVAITKGGYVDEVYLFEHAFNQKINEKVLGRHNTKMLKALALSNQHPSCINEKVLGRHNTKMIKALALSNQHPSCVRCNENDQQFD
ncbi:hypothetical protein MAR_035792 [Mya arenaria]|uniref:Uncharacterized protein n=1 Tax=Mya arenaria TaxID=6604 RepID=A0ABY7EPS3_MYAAR|nr:hypothetical protein MAR_035792 [Mya arenaria]